MYLVIVRAKSNNVPVTGEVCGAGPDAGVVATMPSLDSKVSNRVSTSVNKSLSGSKALSFETFDDTGIL
jgi:hypothetical protein